MDNELRLCRRALEPPVSTVADVLALQMGGRETLARLKAGKRPGVGYCAVVARPNRAIGEFGHYLSCRLTGSFGSGGCTTA